LTQVNANCVVVVETTKVFTKRRLLMRLRFGQIPTIAMAAAAAFASLIGAGATVAAATAAPSFKQDVLPILNQHCIQCHSEGHIGFQSIGLDLTTFQGVMNGSQHGRAVIPMRPQMSPLVKVLDWSKGTYPHMPANQHQLDKKEVDTISAWIAAGAKDD